MKKGKIPFKSKYFDSISLLEIIEHLSDRDISKILNESYRVLKENGKLFITTPNYYSFWPILEFIINQFSDVSYEEQHINKFNKIESIEIVNNSKRPLLIFPQGTRLLPQERTKFKKGTGRIYDTLKIKCQPVALNSGYVWPKNKQLSNNKTITVSILKPISPGLDKEKFINLLQNNIYSELDKMN